MFLLLTVLSCFVASIFIFLLPIFYIHDSFPHTPIPYYLFYIFFIPLLSLYLYQFFVAPVPLCPRYSPPLPPSLPQDYTYIFFPSSVPFRTLLLSIDIMVSFLDPVIQSPFPPVGRKVQGRGGRPVVGRLVVGRKADAILMSL